ncbi:MAG: hypothetical protein M0T79_07805 [Actinomycetota bacterium]|nr:hypothetical protein [Actinomycetota bacterium]
MALSAGDQFSYVRPIMSYEYATAANIEYSEYLMGDLSTGSGPAEASASTSGTASRT